MELLKFIIEYLAAKGVPLTKINIQKIVFYLREVGIPVKYRFEPYLYGPYSSELKSDLGQMEIWENITPISNTEYSVKDCSTHNLSDKIKKKTSNKIDQFIDVVNNNFLSMKWKFPAQ